MVVEDESDYGDGGYKVVVVASVLVLVQFLMLFGRCYSRRLQHVMLEADDHVLILATIFTFALCAIAIAFPRIAAVGYESTTATQQTGVGEAHHQQGAFIAWMTLYGASVALSKCAILLLYIRVFTTNIRKFAFAACAIGAVVGATGITTIVGSIAQCVPISRNWNMAIPGRCIDKLAFARYTAISNVITGFLMLLLPLPMVWRLNVAVQQKVALTATFLHGIIGFAASVARLAILFESPQTRSLNWLAISWTIWTIVEPANYVIAACLPTLRPIFVKILPQSFFVLTYKRRSKPYSSLKIPWPKERTLPQGPMASADISSPSNIVAPWESSRIQPPGYQYTSRTQSEATLAA